MQKGILFFEKKVLVHFSFSKNQPMSNERLSLMVKFKLGVLSFEWLHICLSFWEVIPNSIFYTRR